MHARPTLALPPSRSTRVLLACLGALLCACGPAADTTPDSSQPGRTSGLVLVDPQHPAHPNWVDLGDIPLGETVRYEVPLLNQEPGPLVIQSIQSGCSCTVPSIYYQASDGSIVHGQLTNRGNVLTLPEGAVAKLLLEVDSLRSPTRNKPKLVVLRIVSDSPTAPFLSLDVRLMVVAQFLAAPSAIDLGRVAINGGGQGQTRVLSVGPEGLQITGVSSTSEGLVASIEETTELGRVGWTLRATVAPPIPLGYRELEIVLATSAPEGEEEGRPFSIPVRVNGVPDFELRPSRLLLQPTNPGEADLAEASLTAHIPGLRFLIEEVTLAGERAQDLGVSVTPDSPDVTGRSSRWVLRLDALADLGAEGCSGTVTVVTDNAEIGTLQVPYIRLPR